MRDISHIISRFREAGLKVTPQRTSICHLLKDDRSHPSAEEIYRKALTIHPSISFTTVYKTLQTLRDLGEIQELNIDPERAHYDPDIQDHAHFFCKTCRTIIDLAMDGSRKDFLTGSFPHAGNLEIQHVQIHMVGLCEECREGSPAS